VSPPRPVQAIRRGATVLRRPLSAPDIPDGILYHGAPALLFLAAILAVTTVPWAPGFRGLDIDIGALLFPAALAYVAPAILMAGWGAGRPQSVIGAFRFLAVLLAYEMPLVMAITAVATPAGSLRPTEIMAANAPLPQAMVQPLALALFAPSVLAVTFLPPFDVAQAAGELGGGAFSEYTGLDAAVIWLSQHILLIAVSGMTATLFFGGWLGPVLPPAVWMIGKTLGLAWLALWVGRRLPRVELDRLLPFVWKVAVPAAIGAIAISGLVTRFFYS
jgi:NADH-quinone oxidoreductase subunit H